ncbi:hypothetical protein ACG2F4_18770 [Halalkalibaculum sp. DA3122]|uniref:hypothetical protein n=1 Tax=unclassified Halalkalibaculum TaxID=2964617 RepID=UPI003754359A
MENGSWWAAENGSPASGLGKVDRPEGCGGEREEKICDFFSGTTPPSGQVYLSRRFFSFIFSSVKK